MRSKNTDHVVMGLSEPVPSNSQMLPLKCQRCGDHVHLVLPADIETLSAIAEAFTKLHRDCEVT